MGSSLKGRPDSTLRLLTGKSATQLLSDRNSELNRVLTPKRFFGNGNIEPTVYENNVFNLFNKKIVASNYPTITVFVTNSSMEIGRWPKNYYTPFRLPIRKANGARASGS